jgi:hypothetical protein
MASAPPPPDDVRPPSPPDDVRPAQEPPALSPQTRELLDFVREEIESNRAYFTSASKIAIMGITILLTLAAIIYSSVFGWRTIHDIEGQAQSVTVEEISKMRGEIRSRIEARINDEFQTDKMQQMIREVAREQTATGLKNEVSSLRGDLDSARADLNRYAMPRVVSPKQARDLSTYLSHREPRAVVTVKVNTGDPEAMEYAAQLVNAIVGGEWEAHMDTSRARSRPCARWTRISPALDSECSLNKLATLRTLTPDTQLQIFCCWKRYRQAHIEVNGTGGAPNRPSYSLSVIVGHRPRTVVQQRP